MAVGDVRGPASAADLLGQARQAQEAVPYGTPAEQVRILTVLGG